MSSAPIVLPTAGELKILHVLWQHDGPATVKDVHDELLHHKETAYTTVLTMLTTMKDKQLVHRDDTGKTHRYIAMHPKHSVQTLVAQSFLQTDFSNSPVALVWSLLADEHAKDEDLNAIGEIVLKAKSRRDN